MSRIFAGCLLVFVPLAAAQTLSVEKLKRIIESSVQAEALPNKQVAAYLKTVPAHRQAGRSHIEDLQAKGAALPLKP